MSEIIFYIAMSLDSYIAIPDGNIYWLSKINLEGEDYGSQKFFDSIDAVLMGSKTYEQILGFGEWSYKSKRTWVFSQRQLELVEPSITITSKSPREVVSELELQQLNRAWLVGGAAIAASFREQGLIDKYIISIIPVILGAGIPLFASPSSTESLHLVNSTSYASGLVQLTYVPQK